MPTITEDLDLPDGTAPTSVYVFLQLWGTSSAVTGFEQGTMKTIGGIAKAAGTPWAITNVVGNSVIDAPVGTVYKLTRTWPGLRDPLVDYITVPASGGPYRVDQILTDPPAAVTSSALDTHAADTLLHGGGRRLGIAHLANQLTASTSFVDLPGATLTLTNPAPGTFDLVFDAPLSIETSGQYGEFQVLAGATVIGTRRTQIAQAANQQIGFSFRLALPSTLYTPVAGASVTYKVQWRSSLNTSDVAVLTEFVVPINSGFLEAVRA